MWTTATATGIVNETETAILHGVIETSGIHMAAAAAVGVADGEKTSTTIETETGAAIEMGEIVTGRGIVTARGREIETATVTDTRAAGGVHGAGRGRGDHKVTETETLDHRGERQRARPGGSTTSGRGQLHRQFMHPQQRATVYHQAPK